MLRQAQHDGLTNSLPPLSAPTPLRHMHLFSYATLAGYEWQHPRLLLLLALVPLLPLLRALLAGGRRRQVVVAFGPGGLRPDWRAGLRFLPTLVLSLSLALLVLATARPQRPGGPVAERATAQASRVLPSRAATRARRALAMQAVIEQALCTQPSTTSVVYICSRLPDNLEPATRWSGVGSSAG